MAADLDGTFDVVFDAASSKGGGGSPSKLIATVNEAVGNSNSCGQTLQIFCHVLHAAGDFCRGWAGCVPPREVHAPQVWRMHLTSIAVE